MEKDGRERKRKSWMEEVRYTSQRPTELVGGRVLRPYVPHGMKLIGEGEGEGELKHLSLSHTELAN